jgi:hypothetical protein
LLPADEPRLYGAARELVCAPARVAAATSWLQARTTESPLLRLVATAVPCWRRAPVVELPQWWVALAPVAA